MRGVDTDELRPAQRPCSTADLHGNEMRAGDDVVVGEDDPARRDDDARTRVGLLRGAE